MKNILKFFLACLILSSNSIFAQIPESKIMPKKKFINTTLANKFIDSVTLIISKNPNDTNYYLRSTAYKYLGSFDNEYKDLSKAIAINDKAGIYFYYRAACEERRNNLVEAKLDFTKAIQLMPEFEWAWNDRGLILAQLNDNENALKDFNKSLQLKPNWGLPYLNIADVYESEWKYDLAEKNYLKSIELQPENYMTYNNLGVLYKKYEKYPQAIEQFQKAITIYPEYVLAMSNLAEVYSRLGDQKKLCATLKQMSDLGNVKASQYYNSNCN